MVSDLKEAVGDDHDMSADAAVEKAESLLWKAKVATFEAHYNKDVALLKRAMQDKFLSI